MAKKMPGRLVALSATAVATIYLAGFASTQAGAQGAPASVSTVSVVASPVSTDVPTAAPPTTAPTVVVGASATPTLAATATAAPAASSTYTDGTYSATGTSALGNVSVSVTIANDKISNVQITRVTTKFPVSRIASLPAQVVQNQTASVNVVTGATYSSQAFKQAVQLALAQAKGA
jgi:uncharacterized protein with FMN-binding domain